MSNMEKCGFPTSRETLLSFLENHVEGIIISDVQGNVLFSNNACNETLNYSSVEIKNTRIDDIIVSKTSKDTHSPTSSLVTLLFSPNTKTETSCYTKDRKKIPVEISYNIIKDEEGSFIFLTLADISDRIALQQKLYRQTITDPLTELFNRRYFDEHLTQEFSRATRYRRPFSTIIIDIDGFKQANDLHGHSYGDKMLLKARDIFNNVLRDGDTVYRYGGDEFAMILPETAKEGAIEVSNRLRERFARQCSDKEKRIKLSLSIGIASYPEDGTDEQALIGAADRRMYQSKESGGNLITAYDAMQQLENDAETLLRSMGALVRLMETSRGQSAVNGISHSQEIRALAVEIGRCMQLPEKRLYLLEQASMLHDIGTIYIPHNTIKKIPLRAAEIVSVLT